MTRPQSLRLSQWLLERVLQPWLGATVLLTSAGLAAQLFWASRKSPLALTSTWPSSFYPTCSTPKSPLVVLMPPRPLPGAQSTQCSPSPARVLCCTPAALPLTTFRSNVSVDHAMSSVPGTLTLTEPVCPLAIGSRELGDHPTAGELGCSGRAPSTTTPFAREVRGWRDLNEVTWVQSKSVSSRKTVLFSSAFKLEDLWPGGTSLDHSWALRTEDRAKP